MSRSRRRIRGITVYPLKSTWAYRITGEPETISGSRIRPYKGGFATEEDAWRAAVDAKKRLEAGRTPHTKSISVSDYFDEWLETVKSNLKDTTTQSYSDMISAYIVPSMGSRRLADPAPRCPAGTSSGSASTNPAIRSLASWTCSPLLPFSCRKVLPANSSTRSNTS